MVVNGADSWAPCGITIRTDHSQWPSSTQVHILQLGIQTAAAAVTLPTGFLSPHDQDAEGRGLVDAEQGNESPAPDI